jgi:formylglycine-generating enzyme required for sulfatase activity
MCELSAGLERLNGLSPEKQAECAALLAADLNDDVVQAADASVRAGWSTALLGLIESGTGSGGERLSLGEFLARLGDPRIGSPEDESYWVTVPNEHGSVTIGRYQVTNFEFKRFVEQGGYENKAFWSEDGWDWLQDCADPWHVRAGQDTSKPFVVANQPVVGITAHEAWAYAASQNARLPTVDERVWVVRGEARRPYPWGSPFGEGNANTVEEVLGRPCAVGLYRGDITPEGVCDLAGNAGEWTADRVGPGYLIHPGAWDQPSLAAWAKALTVERPESRWAGLGFRLARD